MGDQRSTDETALRGAPDRDALDYERSIHFNLGALRDPFLPAIDKPTTFGLALRLEDEPVAVRIGLANDIGLDYPVAAVAACARAEFGDGFNPVGGAPWTLLTAKAGGSGAADDASPGGFQRSFLVPGNGGGVRVPNLCWTDWAPIESIPSDDPGRPILFIRVSAPPWVSPRGCHVVDAPFNDWLLLRSRKLISTIRFGEDVATAPGTNVLGGILRWGASPVYCVQYRGRTRGATVLWGGDSHFAGDTAPGNMAPFPLISCLELSTPDRPVAAANYGWTGTPSRLFMPILEGMVEACRPRFVVLQGWTANDGASEAAAAAYAERVMRLAQRARSLGAQPILVTRLSRITLFQNPSERAIADRLRRQQLALNSPDFPVIDAAAVLDDPTRPGAFKPGLSADGVHPNLEGHTVVAAQLTPVLRKLLSEAAPAESGVSF